MCCMSIQIYGSDDDRYTQHQCMDKGVAELSQGIWIDDYFFEYQCQGNVTWSKAVNLAAGASILLAIASMV